MSSKVKSLDKDTIKLLKYGSWATSAGHADWYVIQTVSPDCKGDYSDLSCFLIFKVSQKQSFMSTMFIIFSVLFSYALIWWFGIFLS